MDALNVEDVTFKADGSGRALIRRSKTDKEGQGAETYLASDTVRYLKQWLEDAEIMEGALADWAV